MKISVCNLNSCRQTVFYARSFNPVPWFWCPSVYFKVRQKVVKLDRVNCQERRPMKGNLPPWFSFKSSFSHPLKLAYYFTSIFGPHIFHCANNYATSDLTILNCNNCDLDARKKGLPCQERRPMKGNPRPWSWIQSFSSHPLKLLPWQLPTYDLYQLSIGHGKHWEAREWPTRRWKNCSSQPNKSWTNQRIWKQTVWSLLSHCL